MRQRVRVSVGNKDFAGQIINGKEVTLYEIEQIIRTFFLLPKGHLPEGCECFPNFTEEDIKTLVKEKSVIKKTDDGAVWELRLLLVE